MPRPEGRNPPMNPMEWDPPVPNQTKDNIVFRTPRINDGAAIWRLVKESGVLDLNSSYMYLLLCKDFSDSCVVAEEDGQLLGFVTGYRPPGRENAIFLWQVGVDAKARGKGLGKRLVEAFLHNPGARGAAYLETTVSPSNEASRALFRAIARDLDTECTISPCFSENQFPDGGHEPEELFRIGPYELNETTPLIS